MVGFALWVCTRTTNLQVRLERLAVMRGVLCIWQLVSVYMPAAKTARWCKCLLSIVRVSDICDGKSVCFWVLYLRGVEKYGRNQGEKNC